MRKLLFFVGIIFFCSTARNAHAAPAIVQSPSYCTESGSTSNPCTFGSNTTTGNLVVACGQLNNTSSSITGVAGTGMTFVDSGTGAVTSTTGAVGTIQCYVAKNITGATTPTVTLTWANAGGSHNAGIIEISGIDTTTPIDNGQKCSNVQPASSATNPNCSVTTTKTNDMLIGFASTQSTTNPGSGFTTVPNQGYTGAVYTQYAAEASTGTYSIIVAENNTNLAGSIIGFALAGVGAAATNSELVGPTSTGGNAIIK